MSFWLFGRKRGKRRYWYSVGVPLLAIPLLVAVLVMLLFTLIRALASWLALALNSR